MREAEYHQVEGAGKIKSVSSADKMSTGAEHSRNAFVQRSVKKCGSISTESAILDISDQELSLEQAQTAEKKLQEEYEDELKKQAKQAEESGEAQSKSLDEMRKMLEIFRRISSGGHVPSSDERKLLEYDSKLYQAAKSMAAMNEDKDARTYKSVYDDEDSDDAGKTDDGISEKKNCESVSDSEGDK